MCKNKKYFKSLSKSNDSKKTKLSIKKAFLSIFIVIIATFVSLLLAINNYLNKINKVDIKTSDFPTEETIAFDSENDSIETSDIINIALFGIDETEGTAGRSDCIMILTIDNKHKELKLCSIIRDSYVTIPTKNKKDKINHAYAFGGPELALETLNENFNLNINKFITVNFSSLPKIIDDVGGITLDITNDEIEYLNGYTHILNRINGTNSSDIINPGNQHVDGTQALAYCRIRYTDGGDFQRSQRHRTVLNQLLQKSKTIPIVQYPKFLDQILPIIHTNLGKYDTLSLLKDLNSFKNLPLLQNRFPSDEDATGKLIDGVYYYVFDQESTTKKIHNFILNQ